MPANYESGLHVSGDVVPESGFYLALHPSGAASYGKILFDKGERFPLCSRCDDVRYTLLPSPHETLSLRKPKNVG
jgi:hypothetical protein